MRLAAVVLAAGSARRFGGDKLSAEFRGEPLVNHAVRAAQAAPAERVIVVCGEALEVPQGVEAVRIRSEALSDSLRAGIAAAGDVDGAFVFLGDMPLVPHGVAAQLAPALGDRFAAVPQFRGKSGHPVLLSRRAFAEVVRLSGDEGAGRLLRQRDDIAYVDVTDEAILLDVDRPDDLARLAARSMPLDKS